MGWSVRENEESICLVSERRAEIVEGERAFGMIR